MPACYSLTPKGATEPEKLSAIDDKMRIALNYPPDPARYLFDWHGVIGFIIAVKGLHLGSAALRADVADWSDNEDYRSAILRALDWLENNYTSDGWTEIGKHR